MQAPAPPSAPPACPRAGDQSPRDAGHSLAEMVVAIGIIALLMFGSLAAIINSLHSQRFAESSDRAVQLANGHIEEIRQLDWKHTGFVPSVYTGDTSEMTATGYRFKTDGVDPAKVCAVNEYPCPYGQNEDTVLLQAPVADNALQNPDGTPKYLEPVTVDSSQGITYTVHTYISWYVPTGGAGATGRGVDGSDPRYNMKRVRVLVTWTLGDQTHEIHDQTLLSPGLLEVIPPGVTDPPAAGPAKTWVALDPIPVARYGAAATADDSGRIYILGGGDVSYSYTNWAHRFDPATDTWSAIRASALSRRHPTAAYSQGRVYLIGGWLSSGATNIVEYYNPANNTWTYTGAYPPVAAEGMRSAVDPQGRIYVVGGYGASGYINQVTRYDPTTNTWTSRAPLPSARGYGAAVFGDDGYLYYIGGSKSGTSRLADVLRYDPAANTWATVAPLPEPRANLAAVVDPDDGHLFVLGGSLSSGHTATTLRYNPTTDTWYSGAPMLAPHYLFEAAVDTQGRVYAIGENASAPGGLTQERYE